MIFSNKSQGFVYSDAVKIWGFCNLSNIDSLWVFMDFAVRSADFTYNTYCTSSSISVEVYVSLTTGPCICFHKCWFPLFYSWSLCPHLIQQDAVWNGKRCDSNCIEQLSAWLPSHSSPQGHKNHSSDSVNGTVEEGKTWNMPIYCICFES